MTTQEHYRAGNMSPTKAAIARRRHIQCMDDASAELVAFCQPHRDAMGLVPDEIRQSPEYRALAAGYEIKKHDLAAFMGRHQGKEYAKAFKAETIEHFKQKRGK